MLHHRSIPYYDIWGNQIICEATAIILQEKSQYDEGLVMIMTYDWLAHAQKNSELKKQIEDALSCDVPQELFIDNLFRVLFKPQSQMVEVRALSEDCVWKCKIIPKRITYYLVREVINGNWNAFSENDIFDLDEE